MENITIYYYACLQDKTGKITRIARKKKEKRLDSKREGNYIFKKYEQLESVSETE